MDKLRIQGGSRLRGRVRIGGAKNAALPALAATLLTDDAVLLRNLPRVRDVRTMLRVLEQLGASTADAGDGAVRVQVERIGSFEAPYDLVKTMRASILALGPLVARHGRARVSLPGGCAIGERPVNFHIEGLREMGAQVEVAHGYVEARAESLRGAEITFPRKTVTGTENLMMAAALARGTTVLNNCAKEPEVVDLAQLLVRMGAAIDGVGSDRIVVEGRERLGGAEHTVIPDRIEAGTYLIAGALTGDDADRDRRGSPARSRAGEAAPARPAHRDLSRLPDRHAGAVHGPGQPGPGQLARDRDDLRAPLHARRRAAAHGRGRADPGRVVARRRPQPALRRAGDGHGPARLGVSRARRARRRGRDRDRPHLSSRSRLRDDGAEAGRAGRGRRAATMSDCVFCRIAAGQIPARRLFEDDDVVAFHDLSPQAPVHVLVIPRRHVASLDAAEDGDVLLLGRLFAGARRAARETGIAAGYRVVTNCGASAGQSVFHIHLHVLGGRAMSWPPG
jgi:diadenosine tetraphosphate (Ap4A) HIT family hydrolase